MKIVLKKEVELTPELLNDLIKEAVDFGRNHEYKYQKGGGRAIVEYPTIDDLLRVSLSAK